MNMPTTSKRLIVIDDQPEIHEAFNKILVGSAPVENAGLAKLRAVMKGGGESAMAGRGGGGYVVDSAHQGQEGYEKICAAREGGEPYSVAFVDMRMPPGWDGFKTIREFWSKDPDIQIVICTAYSDQPWSDIDELAEKSDRVLVLKKPFDPVEIRRMASTLSSKWRLARQTEAQREELLRTIEMQKQIIGLQQQAERDELDVFFPSPGPK